MTELETLEAFGIHCICELYDCPSESLNDVGFVTAALREAADVGLATLLHEVSHKFHPQGVTALGLIAESHLAIHTWPEFGYVAVDVFTCGRRASAEKACLHLARTFGAKRYSLRKLDRGLHVPQDVGSAQRVPEPVGIEEPGLGSG